MDQAKEISSWRDRPQLLMIISSVRRGIAYLKSSGDDEAGIPRLLPIIANFLARASFVVATPDHPLYEAINRYFLKSEAGHGAFQDFNRLPAFMSLFCSRASDPLQNRAERLWTLHNIRDGLMDSASFRVMASCHAPELILTSFENVRLSKLSGKAQGTEYCLLLESLQAVLDCGGHAAQLHLMRRCGLLAWMNSICSRELTQFFPTTKSAVSFCKLAKSAISVLLLSDQLRTALINHEACGLIEPLLLLCLLDNSEEVVSSAQETLGVMSTLLKEAREPKTDPGMGQAGASLHSTLLVLELVEDASRESMLEILCNLPISFATGLSREDTDNFILLSLDCGKNRYLRAKDSDDNYFTMLILQRMSLLLERSKEAGDGVSTTKGTHDIPKKIFSLRSSLNFTHANNAEDLWTKCLQLAQELYPQGDGGSYTMP
ncbi:MAG: hypothetical protein SGILL_008845 [Bacillariaceae sp.]